MSAFGFIESTTGSTGLTPETVAKISSIDQATLDALINGTFDNTISTANFNNLLSPTEDTMQKAFDKLDNVAATNIPEDGTNFGVSLAPTDNTVQKALDKLDDHAHSGAAVPVSTVSFNNILSASENTVQKALDKLDEANQYNPNGFENMTDSQITFGATTVSIAPKAPATSFKVYVHGPLFTKTGTETVTRLVTDGIQYIYYDAAGTLQISSTIWDFDTTAPVAYFCWDSTSSAMIYTADERHSITMSVSTHAYLHSTFGTRWQNGFDITINTSGDGSSDSHCQFSLTSGTIWDEDIRIPIGAFTAGDSIPTLYRSGATSWRRRTTNSQYPFYYGANALYNLNSAGNWGVGSITNTNFIASWVIATNNIQYPLLVIAGQRQDTSLDNAHNNNLIETLSLSGIPAQEIKILYRVIFEYNTAFANTPKMRAVSYTDLRAGSGSVINGTYTTLSHSALSGLNDNNVHKASSINVSAQNFGGTLNGVTGSNKNVQYALDTIDDLNLSVKGINSYGFGNAALSSISTGGNYNIGIGHQAGQNITAGQFNVCVGINAGKLITDPVGNTCLGPYAGDTITTGTGNICIGYQSDGAATGGSQIALGNGAVTGGTDSVAIGHSTTAAAAQMVLAPCTTANTIIIGNANTSSTTINGYSAKDQAVTTSAFGGVLTATENTIQKCLDKLDDHTHGYSLAGDVTVGGYLSMGSGNTGIKTQILTGTLAVAGSYDLINCDVTGNTTGYLRIVRLGGVVQYASNYQAIPMGAVNDANSWWAVYIGGQIKVSTGASSSYGGLTYILELTYKN